MARLVRLRGTDDALARNDTAFLHVDLNDSKRVAGLAPRRPGSEHQIVVVANFSDFANFGQPFAEYVVPELARYTGRQEMARNDPGTRRSTGVGRPRTTHRLGSQGLRTR